jgi:hypothetical protein
MRSLVRFSFRFSFRARIRTPLVAAALALAPSLAQAQAQAASMTHDELMALAKVFVLVTNAHDSIDAQLAQPRNKTVQAQQQLRDLQVTQREEILHHAGMTPDEYEHKIFLLSSDDAARKMFDAMVAQITGDPTPGQAPPSAPAGPPAVTNLPAGAVGTHIGHVVNAFGDTPKGMGLLPTAMAEARTASSHAVLAAKDPTNLASMQLHAGHVINALDPTIVAAGPGLGYGVKKAATGVATHIELAAKAPGASQNVMTHAVHIATSARNTVDRADKIIALCQQVRNATSAADAAPLISQIVSLTDQLIKGADANADGKITWEKGEGGLQQAQEHITLMLAAEKPALH